MLSVLGIGIRQSLLFSRGESYIFFLSVLDGLLSVVCSRWQTEHLHHSTVGFGDYSLSSSDSFCWMNLNSPADAPLSCANFLRFESEIGPILAEISHF